MHSHNNLCPCTVLAWNEDGLRKRIMHAEILVPLLFPGCSVSEQGLWTLPLPSWPTFRPHKPLSFIGNQIYTQHFKVKMWGKSGTVLPRWNNVNSHFTPRNIILKCQITNHMGSFSFPKMEKSGMSHSSTTKTNG